MKTVMYRFDPVDLDQMRLLGRLPRERRVRIMLEARELAVGLIRGRIRRQYPHLPPEAINLKMLEEVTRVERTPARPYEVWCACPEDVIIGKLMAWAEGRSRKHETDIYEMMVFYYLGADPALSAAFDEGYVDAQARTLGADVAELWEAVKDAARQEADGGDS